MIKMFLTIILVLSILLAVGCSSPSKEVTAALGQSFDLKFGQTVSINGEQLKLTFVEMLGDSRCPKNVICIWEGEVSCKIEITYADKKYFKTLVKSGASPEFVSTEFKDYEIQFDVQPYPEAVTQLKDQDYYLKLIVTKNPS